MTDPEICGITYKDFVIRVEEFHGYRSPGNIKGNPGHRI
jgi:hypothetical protein